VTPRLLSISPSTGSPAGSMITAIVKGVGSASTGVVLTRSTGVWICTEVTVPQYGVVKCRTNATSISTAEALRARVGTTTYQCSTSGACSYQTSTALPAITGL